MPEQIEMLLAVAQERAAPELDDHGAFGDEGIRGILDSITSQEQSEQDYYEVLSIAPTANARQIKKAYRKLSFRYHPDRNQASLEANNKMQKINEAYDTLSDPIKRREYDLPRGYGNLVPKFKKGSKVTVGSNSNSPYRDHTGIVDTEPIADTFRFWYTVKFESKDLPRVSRFAEEELEEDSE